MPELPEVETVRRALDARITGRTVIGCTLRRRDVLAVPGDPPGGFSRSPARTSPRRARRTHLLLGGRLTPPMRHGKQLALGSEDGRRLVVHLGMTGQLLHASRGRRLPVTDHQHATIRLDDGSRLVFRDPRRFGGLWALGSAEALVERWGALGPDALTLTEHQLADRLAGAHRPIKAVLLDQSKIAGIGNIYADESLFEAGIHPDRRAASLTGGDIAALAAAIRGTLKAAVAAGGSTIRDYTDPMSAAGEYQRAHRVYGRAGLPCRRCGAELRRTLVAQRTTVYCVACQPEGP